MGCLLTNFLSGLQRCYPRLAYSLPLDSESHPVPTPRASQDEVKVYPKAMHGHPSIQLTHVGTRTERAKHDQIFRAVRNRDKQLLRSLIVEDIQDEEAAQSLVCVSDKNGVNPVELACLLGYTEEVTLFIEHGCSPNLPTSIGRLVHTVLECIKSQSIGMQEGHQLLRFMCDKGCDVRMKDRKRKCTLLYATELGDPDILQLIIRYGGCGDAGVKDTYSGYTPLHMAAMKGDLECLQVLLREGPGSQINIHDNADRTALLLALKNMIHDLRYLNTTSDPSQMSGPNRDKLVLHQYNAIAVVEALLVAGADANLGDPLSCALTLVQLDEKRRFNTISPQSSPYLSSLNRRCQTTVHAVYSGVGEIGSSSVGMARGGTSPDDDWVSPYTGVVRLLVYSGAQPQEGQQTMWQSKFRAFPYVLKLVQEVTDFWKCYERVKPPKLLHLCKQCVRSQLAKNLKLHEIDSLLLPPSLIDYLKLRCL
ncbi:uncharacterized protein LOC135473746 [Liolophura sinensis]|uniref:uncharacterized protein LOC135473746 n=1 Tax=Liolophura sinensis TaxID=3198878 RepID=UPI003158665C